MSPYFYPLMVSVLKLGVGRDALDATVNYTAHTRFVAKWLEKLEAEDPAASDIVPTPTSTAEEPQPQTTAAPSESKSTE